MIEQVARNLNVSDSIHSPINRKHFDDSPDSHLTSVQSENGIESFRFLPKIELNEGLLQMPCTFSQHHFVDHIPGHLFAKQDGCPPCVTCVKSPCLRLFHILANKPF